MPEQRIINTIQDELETYTSLQELLLEQQQQLLDKNTSSLTEIAHQITSLLESSRNYRQERSKDLKALDLKNTPEGMDQFIQNLKNGKEEVLGDWEELMGLVEECKEINKKNGHTLKIQQQLSERMLERLKLQSSETGAYSADGQAGASLSNALYVQA